jgi:hypothetical protein
MNPHNRPKDSDAMRLEYDFSHGVRGKHYKAYQVGTNVVFLDPDIAVFFPDSASVNQALRLLVTLEDEGRHWQSASQGAAGDEPCSAQDQIKGAFPRGSRLRAKASVERLLLRPGFQSCGTVIGAMALSTSC